MIKFVNHKMLQMSAAFVVGLMASSSPAQATSDASTIAENITTSISGLPGLLTGGAYLIGIFLGVLGILKIKEHVENPTSAKLKDGAIRLAAGGGMFALPIIYEAMRTTIGQGGGVEAAPLTRVEFAVQ